MEIRETEKIIDEAHKTHGVVYLLNEMRADYNNFDILCSFFIASGKNLSIDKCQKCRGVTQNR